MNQNVVDHQRAQRFRGTRPADRRTLPTGITEMATRWVAEAEVAEADTHFPRRPHADEAVVDFQMMDFQTPTFHRTGAGAVWGWGRMKSGCPRPRLKSGCLRLFEINADDTASA